MIRLRIGELATPHRKRSLRTKRPWLRRVAAVLLLQAVLLVQAGCLYPEERRVGQEPSTAFLQEVQGAVDRFRQAEGVLPIQTRPADTPRYEKYPIDFRQLVPRFLAEVPPNAFEQGGRYQYVLIDVETAPQVRLLDLTVAAAVNEVQAAVTRYWKERGVLPIRDVKPTGFYGIDYAALHLQLVQVKSPYTGQYLPLLMDPWGRVGVDYALDLVRLLPKDADVARLPQDLRDFLARNHPFVPVRAFPYRLVRGEPVPLPQGFAFSPVINPTVPHIFVLSN